MANAPKTLIQVADHFVPTQENGTLDWDNLSLGDLYGLRQLLYVIQHTFTQRCSIFASYLAARYRGSTRRNAPEPKIVIAFRDFVKFRWSHMRDSVLTRIASIENALKDEENRLRSIERNLYMEAMADRQRQQEASSIVADLHRQEQQRVSSVAVELQRQRRPQATRAANKDYREQQRLAAIGPILQLDDRDTFVVEELVGVDTFEKSSQLVSSLT